MAHTRLTADRVSGQALCAAPRINQVNRRSEKCPLLFLLHRSEQPTARKLLNYSEVLCPWPDLPPVGELAVTLGSGISFLLETLSCVALNLMGARELKYP